MLAALLRPQTMKSLARRLTTVAQIATSIWYYNRGVDRVWFMLRALIWQLQKRVGRSFVTTLSNGARLKVHPESPYSGIFYYRWVEREETLFIRSHSHRLPKTFVDVGANVGIFSAQLFDKFSRFYLFEPARSSFEALKETCALNPSVNCIAFNLAIADMKGTLGFIEDDRFSSTSRAVDLDRGTDVSYSISADTLDNILASEQDDIVLKVDVEGFEERVFAGARNLFRQTKVKLVLFERLGRTNIDRIVRFFDDVNYVLFLVDVDGKVTRDDEKVRQPLVNLFACPSSSFPMLMGSGS